jgi:hypothetical protein
LSIDFPLDFLVDFAWHDRFGLLQIVRARELSDSFFSESETGAAVGEVRKTDPDFSIRELEMEMQEYMLPLTMKSYLATDIKFMRTFMEDNVHSLLFLHIIVASLFICDVNLVGGHPGHAICDGRAQTARSARTQTRLLSHHFGCCAGLFFYFIYSRTNPIHSLVLLYLSVR